MTNREWLFSLPAEDIVPELLKVYDKLEKTYPDSVAVVFSYWSCWLDAERKGEEEYDQT